MERANMDDFGFPQPPKFDEAQLQRCREVGDFCPILFKWYQFVGLLCNFFARIRSDSPDIRGMPPLHHAVLVGLTNRCSRLMLANTALSHEGLFGETTAILDRCIFESGVKIMWLCTKADDASFRRLVLDGLKSDVEFRKVIFNNIASRGGETLVIEKRMLQSIDDYLATVSATEADVSESQKLPDLASMITVIGQSRLAYIVGQRIGSHHVHGTWPSLFRDYLEDHAGVLGPRDHDCPTQASQYVFVIRIILDALRSLIGFAVESRDSKTAFTSLLDDVQDEVQKINAEVVGDDFERAAGF
jgi:hypothetical protein